MNGEKVGRWSVHQGAHVLQYDPDWVASPAGRALSLSLSFTPSNAPHRGESVANYFDNLLPDSDAIRSRLRTRYGTTSTESFDLLTAIGRDCVGAVQLLPDNQGPDGYDRIEAEPLSDGEIETSIAVSLSSSRILGQEEPENLRISLAGAQEKTALLRHRGKWCRPLGATPTTHILKLPLGLVGHLQVDMKDSVENEWLCSRLMRAFGMDIAHCEIAQFGARKVLIVERFDRAKDSAGWIARLPQEDFCQALGLPSTQKYETDGGPGMRDILRVLSSSKNAQEDKHAFVKAQILFWMLAATDGHAKNFSIFHTRGGRYRLTPLYDVLSAWPIIGRGANQIDWHKAKMAMAVRGRNAHWKLCEIKARHWDSVAGAAGLVSARAIIEEIAECVEPALADVNRQIPRGFPPYLLDSIFQGIRKTGALLKEAL